MAREKKDWMKDKWRPMMGWVYMATCTTDFVLFPIMWAGLKAYLGQPVDAWQPLTLQGAGLYHLAMGAVLGVAAWSRGQEKLAGVDRSYTVVATEQPVSIQPDGQVFLSKYGKPSPVINEPLL